jgi:hypothetical protein
MFNTWKKEINKLKKHNLSIEEKASIRASILSFMEYHPIKSVIGGEELRQVNQRSLLSKFNFNSFMPIALVIALLLSGSATFAAERAMPGDFLYPVKVNVNEEVRGMVALNTEAKAEWEAKRAERRLEEAEKLALSGEIKVEVMQKLEQKFNQLAEKAEARITKLEDAGKVEAASKLNASLEARYEIHERVLAYMTASTTASSSVELIPLGLLVSNKVQNAEKVRERMEASMSERSEVEIEAAASGKIGAAENKIEATEKFFALKKDGIEADSYAEAEASLKLAKDALAEAKVLFAAEKYSEAFVKAGETINLAQQAHASIRVYMNLDKQMEIMPMQLRLRSNATSSQATTGLNLNLNLSNGNSDDDDDNDDRGVRNRLRLDLGL